MQAKYLGYTPKYRYLKPGAVPTIFEDSKPIKRREASEKRIEKKKRQELIDSLLCENQSKSSKNCDVNNLDSENRPGPSTEVSASISTSAEPLPQNTTSDQSDACVSINPVDLQSAVLDTDRKRKPRKTKKTKSKKMKVEVTSKTKEIGIQVSIETSEKEILCNIPVDYSVDSGCANCYAREHPTIVINDHLYSAKKPKGSDLSKPTTSETNKKHDDMSIDNIVSESEGEIDDQDEFKTPTKAYKDDPNYEPSDSDYSPVTPQNVQENINSAYVNQTKCIVFLSCLNNLFAMLHCQKCGSPMDTDDTNIHFDGTCLSAKLTCLHGHEFKWRSQPLIGQQPAGNILVTAAACFSGNTFAKLESFSDTLKLPLISKTTYQKIEKDYVIPTIHNFWTQQKDIITRSLSTYDLVVSGDGRCDSPGFSAKYCTYTIMDSMTSAIIVFNIVQVTEANHSSSKMELIGFERTMEDMKRDNLKITTIATDRHVQIRKCIKDKYPEINHQFDVWHLAKSIRKKLIAVAKKKANEDLMPWIKSISNHLWFCASQCNEDADLLVEMWTSIVYHIQNIHTFEGEKIKQCKHEAMSPDEIRKKKWLRNDSKALKALKDIVCDKRLLKDIRKLNLFCHTGNLENYHSMMLKYVPKRQAFGYAQMVARTQLAALDHNFNLKREVAVDHTGQQRFGIMFPKASGRWGVRKVYVSKTYNYRQEMMSMVVDKKLSGDTIKAPHQEKSKVLPRNIAPVPAPSKASLVEGHVTRFKIVE